MLRFCAVSVHICGLALARVVTGQVTDGADTAKLRVRCAHTNQRVHAVIARFRYWLAGLIAPRVLYLPKGADIELDGRLIHLPPTFPPVVISQAALTNIVALYRWHCHDCAHAFVNSRAFQSHDCKSYREFPIEVTIDTSNLE